MKRDLNDWMSDEDFDALSDEEMSRRPLHSRRSRGGKKRSGVENLVRDGLKETEQRFVWKDEFQDIMWVFHDHLRQHNYGLLHRAIHDMLDHYELEQPPDAE